MYFVSLAPHLFVDQILNSLGTRASMGTFTRLIPTQALSAQSVTELQLFLWAPVILLRKWHLWSKSLCNSHSVIQRQLLVSQAQGQRSFAIPEPKPLSVNRGLSGPKEGKSPAKDETG